MKTFLRTQAVAIFFSIGWIVYLNLITFLNNPNLGTIRYIDTFIWLFAIVLTIIYLIIVRNYIGRSWLAFPLIFFPYLLVYQYIFPLIQRAIGIGGSGYYVTFDFISIRTTSIVSMSVFIATLLGIMLSKRD